MSKKTIILVSISILGALSGFLYWRFIGCLSGACPIWSNPWISTGYGALLGYLIGGLFVPSKKSQPAEAVEE